MDITSLAPGTGMLPRALRSFLSGLTDTAKGCIEEKISNTFYSAAFRLSFCPSPPLPPGDSQGMKKLFLQPFQLLSFFFGGMLLFGIYLTSFYSYLLFHSIAEVFSILVSFSIFLFAWNTLNFTRIRYLFVLGTAYLFVGGFDLLHMMAYKGMNIFAIEGTNLATQTWIAARYLEAFSLLALPFIFHRRLHHLLVLGVYSFVSISLFLSIFVFPIFPMCFVEGSGLTPFKRLSEYVICAILAIAVIMLYRRRAALHLTVFRLLTASIGFTIVGELAFTAYTHAYDSVNLIGHLLKIVSYYLVYRAILVHGLLKPYQSMFRELEEGRAELEKYSHELEIRVAERTMAIEERNRELKALSRQLMDAEENERRRIARDLHDSIGQSLSAIKFHVENALSDIGDRLHPGDRQLVNNLVPMIKSVITDVRRIIRNLRPTILDNLGILAAIEWQCQQFNAVYADIQIEKKLEVADHRVPEGLKTPILRLVQESLNNAGRHSGAGKVNISLRRRNGSLTLEIIDDGCGFDPDRNRGAEQSHTSLGLFGMKERAELSGAEFSIDSKPGQGTQISATWQAGSA